MADKGKDKLPTVEEEGSSSTHRHRRDRAGVQPTASARTERVPQPSMTAQEQEQDDLFAAQLMSMVGTFEQLVKNPRMQKFLKTDAHRTVSQAGWSQHATSKQTEHVERVPMVQAGPVLHTSQVQDPAAGNGQGSNVQMFMPTISNQIAAQPGYFGGGSIFQAMARQPTSFPGFMPGGSSGYIPAQSVNPLYANIGVQPGHQTLYIPVLMPAAPVSRAEFSRPLEHMAARTGEARAEKAPRDLPFLLPPVYDHLTPKSSKPKDYRSVSQI